MSSENRETQHASGTTLPSHPVELGESDMENSRSVNPEVQQLRSEARGADSTGKRATLFSYLRSQVESVEREAYAQQLSLLLFSLQLITVNTRELGLTRQALTASMVKATLQTASLRL